jgi:hypothetical protein
MSAETLPPFPVDDVTLSAIEHALDSVLTYEGENGERLDEPRRIGAEYGLAELLDFLGGTTGDEGMYRIGPNGERIDADEAARDDALGLDQWWMDERPHYHPNDVIRALIAEVRRLREGGE